MWYLYGLIISLLIFTILPIVRYRSYWNRVLKEPRARNYRSLDMLGEHLLCSFYVFKHIDYEEYKRSVLHPETFDTFDLCMFIFMYIVFTAAWVIVIPLMVIIWILSTFVKFLQKSIDKKIQTNSQSE